ncbi:MAG TPA: SDR family oxidoreductase [Chthoniobacteraceae bacterium]|nr:SDR family oxidoreductase [Chthoniobacteraceae bacterium]
MSRGGSTFQFADLAGRTLVVTGVTSGIGRALLPGFLEQGLRLILVGQPMEAMLQVRVDLGADENRVRLFECDLAESAQVRRLAQSLLAAGGPVHGLLHNAGIDPRAGFESAGMDFWHHVFEVNLFSAVALTREWLPLLRREGGGVIFTGSVMDPLGSACATTYVASKAALTGLTRSLAHELQGEGINVNCILPGAVQVEKELRRGDPIQRDARLISLQSLTRRLQPCDLLGLVCLLLSGAGEAITGQCITVDGGLMHPISTPASQKENR